MAIRFFDHFDAQSSAQLFYKWTSLYTESSTAAPTIATGQGARGTNALQFEGTLTTDPQPLGKVLTLSGTTVFVGFRFLCTGAGWGQMASPANAATSAGLIIQPGLRPFIQASMSWLCWLRVNAQTHIAIHTKPNGQLAVWRSNGETIFDSAPTLLGTTTFAVPLDTYVYLDLTLVLHATAGSVVLRVNGDTWLSLTNINTLGKSNSVDLPDHVDELILGGMRRLAGTPVVQWRFDDLYIGDTTVISTGTLRNDIIAAPGDVRIDYRVPTADGALTGYTPSSGILHYAMVDEVPSDDDATYNAAATVGLRDSFLQAGAPTGATVLGMFVEHTVRNPLGGISQTAGFLRMGGVNYDGVTRANATNYQVQQDLWTKRPTDSAAWTVADTASAEPGYHKTG